MKRREAEKLLGGYAMGILTEAERRTLFEAALEHQEIFDALLDEEALRELLADPAARQRLLADLSAAGPAKIRPFWRKPAVLGLAASLFLVVTTSLMLRRQPTEALPARLPETAKAELGQAADLAAKEAPAAAPGITKPQVPKVAGAVGRGSAPKQVPVPEEGLRESSTRTLAKAAPPTDQEKGLQAAESTTLAAAAPSPVMAKQAKAASGLSDSSRPEANRAEAKVDEAEAMGPGLAPFSHALQRLPDGRYRLTVTWEGDGHVYLVRRATAAASEIPATSTQAKARQRTAVFEFTLEPGQVLDLFLRAQPEPDPAALPPTEDGRGRWQRIVPGSAGP